MALRTIRTEGDSVLEKICRPVEKIDKRTKDLVGDMLETMYAAPGVGLAAPQVGKNIRLLVMDPAAKDESPQPRVLVNPVLKLEGEDVLSEREGCLSVPLQYRADVWRKSRAILDAQDLDGNPVHEELEGFPAIVMQHEYDHLEGILFIDRISRLRRTLYESKVKKWLKRRNAG